MTLYTLPNGDAVDPKIVRCVRALPGGKDDPPRVIVWWGEYMASICNCETDDEAKDTRDGIIIEINDLRAAP